jgi:hypothetical protein
MQINSCTLGQNKFFRGCRSTGGSGVPKQISFKVGSHICKHVGICYTGHNIPKLNKKKTHNIERSDCVQDVPRRQIK